LWKIKGGYLNNPTNYMELSLHVILSEAKDLVSYGQSRFLSRQAGISLSGGASQTGMTILYVL